MFANGAVTYRVFVTNLEKEPIDFVTGFYSERASAENLIKEAKKDAGLTAHPSGLFDTNSIHFQLAMLACNLNCWLLPMQRSEEETVETLKHTTMARRECGFCSSRPRSGAMPCGRASATATSTSAQELQAH